MGSRHCRQRRAGLGWNRCRLRVRVMSLTLYIQRSLVMSHSDVGTRLYVRARCRRLCSGEAADSASADWSSRADDVTIHTFTHIYTHTHYTRAPTDRSGPGGQAPGPRTLASEGPVRMARLRPRVLSVLSVRCVVVFVMPGVCTFTNKNYAN